MSAVEASSPEAEALIYRVLPANLFTIKFLLYNTLPLYTEIFLFMSQKF